jgi:N-acetylglucosamine malate deacetylase 1
MGSVVIICAHSDDQVFGPGGTAIKLAREGKDVYTIIFSFGEMSNVWLKKSHITRLRVKEAKQADKIIGGKGVFFLGLKEGQFQKGYIEKHMDAKLTKLLERLKPEMIFTHSHDDPLWDHKMVHRLVMSLYDTMALSCPVYVFDVWTLFNMKDSKHPKYIVDITRTFKTKIRALAAFKSQWHARFSLVWSVYFRAIFNGFKFDKRLAEVFYKVR